MLPRAALVCAAVAGALNVSSYLGLTMSSAGGAFAMLHLVVMVLGFALFARLGQHHFLAMRAGGMRPDTSPLPTRLIWATAIALAYLLVLVFGMFALYGEGYAELRGGRDVWVAPDSSVRILAPGSTAAFDARALRVFSAAWVFMALLIALVGHRVAERIRGYQEARRQATA